MTGTERVRNRGRGQLVLVAAAVAAIALVPVVGSYLQLGYAGDVDAATTDRPDGSYASRVLERAVVDATAGVPQDYGWTSRKAATAAVRGDLADPLAALRTARLIDGAAYVVDYDPAAADAWAAERCPRGPARQFGSCVADDGIVVQERAGETHVVAVAFEVRTVATDGSTRLTIIVRNA